MTKTVTILGGPRHGTRVHVAPTSDRITCAELTRLRDRYGPPGWNDLVVAEPSYATVTYETIRLPLAPERFIRGALHPDITRDTGQRLLADLVIATWERHGVGQ